MKIDIIECPSCGANLDYKGNSDSCICEYCGNRVFLNEKARMEANLNVEKLKHRERMRNKELESEKMACESEKRTFIIILVALLSLVVLCAIGVIAEHVDTQNGKVKMPESTHSLEGDNYIDVMNKLKDVGFNDIECIEMSEGNIFQKKGDVDRIVIGGENDYKTGEYVDPNLKVKIYYYP